MLLLYKMAAFFCTFATSITEPFDIMLLYYTSIAGIISTEIAISGIKFS